MSTQDPGTEAHTDQDVAVPVPRQPGASRRFVAAFAVAALIAATIGAGVWAWQSFMDQGAQPAEALPANTLGYAALDLDPPGSQKVAAYNALRKFPSIKRELGLDSVEDVQKSVVDEVTSDSDCGLSYAALKPWLGDRMAAAVVPLKKPEPVAVLQVADSAKASRSLTKLGAACDFGFAIKGDWAIIGRTTNIAKQVSAATSEGTLSNHPDYKRLTGAAGDPGLVTLYAAPEAGKAILDALEDDPFAAYFVLQGVNSALDPVTSFVSSFGLLAFVQPSTAFASPETDGEAFAGPDMTPAQKKEFDRINRRYEHYEELSPEEQKALDQESEDFYSELFKGHDFTGPPDAEEDGDPEFTVPEAEYGTKIDPALRKSLKEFTGLGGIGRIADGAVEIEVVGDQLEGTSAAMYGGDQAGDLVKDLPKDAAIAFGARLADGWVDWLFTQISTQYLFSDTTSAETIKSFEKATGLDVPGDLEALGGSGFSFVAGPGFDPERVFEDPAESEVGARLSGDPEKIEAALDKLRSHLGAKSAKLVWARAGDDVVVSANADFLEDLTKGGDLAGSDTFKNVVKNADDAASVFFINFDAGDWLVKQTSGEDRSDAEPLRGLGLTVTKHDGQQHLRFRLSFD